MKKILNQELVDYIEGVHFKVNTFDHIIQLSYVPSELVEIDNDTKDYYVQKLLEARYEFNQVMNELKTEYFPEATVNDTVYVNFSTREITLQNGSCSCGGSCSK